MFGKSGRGLHWSAGLLVAPALFAGAAHAQDADEGPHGASTVREKWALRDRDRASQGPVPVWIRGTVPGLRVSIFERRARTGRDEPITSCITPCRLVLPRSTYRLYAYETERTTAGSSLFDIDRRVVVDVDPSTRAHRTVGIALIAGGAAALTLGSALFIVGLGTLDGSQSTRSNPTMTRVGAGVALAGLIALPVGVITLLTSFTPSVEVEPMRVPSTPRSARIAPAGAGWSFAF